MVAATKANPEKQRVIMVNQPLWDRVTKQAKKAKVSVSEFVRQALAAYVS